ncbi:NnrS family protein, partial [Massilia cavernae]
MSLLTIEEPTPDARFPPWSGKHALWALGFRPLYLLAALLAVLAIPAWVASYLGWLTVSPNITLGWHMHEMVFGFAIAVVVGFLFTAGRAWTGLWTPRGLHLAALALLWLAARIAMLTGPAWLAAIIDISFLPLAAWSMYRVLHRAGNRRNMFLVVLLALLTVANGAFHAAAMHWIPLSVIAPVHAGILLIVLIESVIGGRVIPMFTDNAVPGTKSQVRPRNDKIAIAVVVAAGAGWVFGAPGPLMAALAFMASIATALRLAGWKSYRAARNPLLWILHLSYAWIPLG